MFFIKVRIEGGAGKRLRGEGAVRVKYPVALTVLGDVAAGAQKYLDDALDPGLGGTGSNPAAVATPLAAPAPRPGPRVSTPALIKTPLHPWQEEGLSFLLRSEASVVKEDGDPDSVGIWRRTNEDRIEYYRNVVTRTCSQSPPALCRGGILADGMGIGKTLQIIALVAATLDRGDPDRRATLVLCPLSLLESTWAAELLKHVHPALPSATSAPAAADPRAHSSTRMPFYVWHGVGRTYDRDWLAEFSIVLSTPETARDDLARGADSILGGVPWRRVVVDEGDRYLRNRTNQFHIQLSTLEATHRWVLSGTPIHNRYSDLRGLVSWLRLAPYDVDTHWDATFVAPPAAQGTREENEVVERCKRLFASISLRRVYTDVADLPPLLEHIVHVPLAREDLAAYRRIASENKRQIEADGNQIHALALLMKVRRSIVLGPAQQEAEARDESDAQHIKRVHGLKVGHYGPFALTRLVSQLDADGVNNLACHACEVTWPALQEQQPSSSLYITTCGHFLCRPCRENWFVDCGPNLRCVRPGCNRLVQLITAEIQPVAQPADPPWRAGAPAAPPTRRVQALVDELLKLQALPDPTKAVVFSNWVTHLNLVTAALNRAGILFVHVDGAVSQERRTAQIRRFREDSTIRVLCATLGSSATGLNLPEASVVFLMEPGWNPQTELQAIARAYRQGQTRTVTVWRFVAPGTIEEKILALQRRKRTLADAVVDPGQDADGALAGNGIDLDAIRDLFR